MATAEVIDKLNEILRWEWTGVAQYSQMGFIVSGPWREVYADLFHDNAKESFKHAKLIGNKIVAMGGMPSVERNDVRQATDLKGMLQLALEFEQGALDLYKECLKIIDEDDVALRTLLEDQCLEEQDGVDHFTKLVREHETLSQSIASGEVKVG